jgi:hypothetical protein
MAAFFGVGAQWLAALGKMRGATRSQPLDETPSLRHGEHLQACRINTTEATANDAAR